MERGRGVCGVAADSRRKKGTGLWEELNNPLKGGGKEQPYTHHVGEPF